MAAGMGGKDQVLVPPVRQAVQVYGILFQITLQIPLRAVQAEKPPALGREGCHRERPGNPIRKFERHDLVIYDIVITVEHTPAERAGPDRLQALKVRLSSEAA